MSTTAAREIRAPRGTEKTCATWQAEAAMRMLMNNLDPQVAERPEDLVVYGGRGKAARSWEAFDAIVATLKRMKADETLLVQSGKPVGVVTTHEDAPRVLIANSNLGILQGTYETFAEAGVLNFKENAGNEAGSLVGKLCVTGGCGGMGGAQPLSVTLNGGTCLIADVDLTRLQRRLDDNYLDELADGIDASIDRAVQAAKNKEAVSIGVEANAVDLLARMIERDITPDVLTDQTSAHDALVGYVPTGVTFEEARVLRESDPDEYVRRSMDTMEQHVRHMVTLQKRGAVTFDYGNNLRQRALDNGYEDAFAFPGFVPAYIRPQFCLGRGPFRWVALSGDPKDIYVTDYELLKMFPAEAGAPGSYNARLHRWILGCHANPDALLAGDFENCAPRFAFQGLPSRICWIGLGERDKAGVMFNWLVRDGKVSAPIVIGRDHLDCGSVASPNRETEAMKDGTDAVSDWPLLNAMVNVASGASWVSFHHGGGVGIGFSQHAGQVVVADGTDKAEARVRRVLTNDPMMGVFRHVDAGYEEAEGCMRDQDVDIPMR
ncbi:hutU [Symbiodinium necroappetens]|uniref:HutU protein n=1 Tax=Symbiodinium necroappetens TaxID=1628268 RepID=A0A812WKU7_9DINO|nr:hutU [Symbiodinium necroappetens]